MSDKYTPNKEFSELLQLIVDGQLLDADHKRLEDLLAEDANAREYMTRFLRVHSLLHYQLVGTSTDWDKKESPQSSQQSHQKSLGLVGKSLSNFAPFVLAATILFAFVFWNTDSYQNEQVAELPKDSKVTSESKEANPLSRPPAPVATLAMNNGAVWKGRQLEVDQLIDEGETLELESGQARISVGYGAELLATAPCSLTFISNDQIRLGEGSIVVDVADWAKGFTVETETMDVVDLGTTFMVSTNDDQTVETKVLSGMVRAVPYVIPEGEKQSVLLTEGEGLKVDGSGNRKTLEPLSANTFNKSGFDGLQPYRPVELHNTGLGLREGEEDPYWRVIAGPATSFAAPCYAQVCVPHERYLENDPNESQWVSIPGWENATPNSIYTFATEFELEGYDLATMRLFGRLLADNGILAVRVNGNDVRVESWTDNIYGQRFDHQEFRFVNVTNGLVDGRNTIEIDVVNGTMRHRDTAAFVEEPNHMALRVEWYAFGRDNTVATKDTSPNDLPLSNHQRQSRANKQPRFLETYSMNSEEGFQTAQNLYYRLRY